MGERPGGRRVGTASELEDRRVGASAVGGGSTASKGDGDGLVGHLDRPEGGGAKELVAARPLLAHTDCRSQAGRSAHRATRIHHVGVGRRRYGPVCFEDEFKKRREEGGRDGRRETT